MQGQFISIACARIAHARRVDPRVHLDDQARASTRRVAGAILK